MELDEIKPKFKNKENKVETHCEEKIYSSEVLPGFGFFVFFRDPSSCSTDQ